MAQNNLYYDGLNNQRAMEQQKFNNNMALLNWASKQNMGIWGPLSMWLAQAGQRADEGKQTKAMQALYGDQVASPYNYDFGTEDAARATQSPMIPVANNGYNPSGDMGVTLRNNNPVNPQANNPYWYRIMEAKNNYQNAQNDDDRNAAHAMAEQARADARAANVQLPSYLQTGDAADYATALANTEALREAQWRERNGKTLGDFVNGTGAYNFDGNGSGNFSFEKFGKAITDPANASGIAQQANANMAAPAGIAPQSPQVVPQLGQPGFNVNPNDPNAIVNGANQTWTNNLLKKNRTMGLMGVNPYLIGG